MTTRPRIVVENDFSEVRMLQSYEESARFQTRLIGLWEQQQRVLGYTEASVALNLRNINEFLEVADRFIWEVTAANVDDFYSGLVGRGLSYSTRRKYQSAISTFLEYLRSRHGHEIWQRYGVAVPNVLDRFNRYHHRLDDVDSEVLPPSPEVLERFWEELKQEMQSARKYSTVARDYALYKLLSLAGLRIFEAVMLDTTDCRFDLGENGKIHVRFGKGSRGTGYKRRWIPMLDGANILLQWYLEHVRPRFTDDKNGPLFLSEGGQRLPRDTARKTLARRQVELGFRKEEMFSAHQLRHAFATNQTERGVDLITLKQLLGHRDIATTFTYSTPGSDFLERRIRLAQEKLQSELLSDKKSGR